VGYDTIISARVHASANGVSHLSQVSLCRRHVQFARLGATSQLDRHAVVARRWANYMSGLPETAGADVTVAKTGPTQQPQCGVDGEGGHVEVFEVRSCRAPVTSTIWVGAGISAAASRTSPRVPKGSDVLWVNTVLGSASPVGQVVAHSKPAAPPLSSQTRCSGTDYLLPGAVCPHHDSVETGSWLRLTAPCPSTDRPSLRPTVSRNFLS